MRRGQKRIFLPEESIPRSWYNVAADMPSPMLPPVNPRTGEPVQPQDLKDIFAFELIKQEASTERYIPIPDEVREKYKLYRPTPLIRATALEKALSTPCSIYYKYEGESPVGSHKLNSALPQAYYNKLEGKTRLTTETGAGQWGTALSFACRQYDLECMVYMVSVSYRQKPYRRSMIEAYGARVVPSPSPLTASGRKILERDPDSNGSLAIAISEAVEDALSRDDTNYTLGSVLNHVVLHQTVIGQETVEALKQLDEFPDVVIGCCGGGSNFGGMAFPFLPEKLAGSKVRLLAVEPAACPTLTRGTFMYDLGDEAGFTPLIPMYTLGHNFMPSGIHAGGLRYHGASALVSELYRQGLVEAVAYPQNDVFEAAVLFARTEGILPAPESSHAIRAAMDEAIRARDENKRKTIVLCLSGHGHFDLSAYDDYLKGNIRDVQVSDEEIARSIGSVKEKIAV